MQNFVKSLIIQISDQNAVPSAVGGAKGAVMADSIQLFEERCEDLAQSPFILADKKISNLLRTVAVQEDLYRLTERTLERFNYEVEFMKARRPRPDRPERMTLVLPDSREKLAAFVFCLLCEFENGERDLQTFLDAFFEADSTVEAFSAFTAAVIRPYRLAVRQLYAEQKAEADPKAAERKPFFGVETVSSEPKALEQLSGCCQEIVAAVSAESTLSAEDKQDMLTLSEALFHAVLTRDKRLIKALFVGCRHTLKGFKNASALLARLEKGLREAWIL